MDIKITIVGSRARIPHKDEDFKHFELLIEYKGKKILIDSSNPRTIDNPDLIIITQPEFDHWKHIKDYDCPIYSSKAVIDKLPEPYKDRYKAFIKPLDIDGLTIRPFKTTHRPGIPSIGICLDWDNKRVAILPEFFKLGKFEKDLIKGTIWIAGVGDYEIDDEITGKISFKSFLKLAEELKPERVYLCNLRETILENKEEIEKELKRWNGKILNDGEILDFSIIKAEVWNWAKPRYRIFTIEDLKGIKDFKFGKGIVEAKFDGVRIQIIKQNGKVEIWTDPDEVKEKRNADKTYRLPCQVKELEELKNDNFRLDAELIIVNKNKNEVLHRTTANALLNGKFNPDNLSQMAYIEVFDILENEGKDLRKYPLKERKEELNKFSDTEHIKFINPTILLTKENLSYIVDFKDLSTVQKALDNITKISFEGSKNYPKFIAEGVMIKHLDKEYEFPQNTSWAKFKFEFEVDGIILDKVQIVRDGIPQNNWNYLLGVGDISEEHAKAIQEIDKEAVKNYKGKWYMVVGKTDNTNLDAEIGDILRVSAEDVNEFNTSIPQFKYYKGYIMRVKQLVPEKVIPDTIEVLRRLAELTPGREGIEKAGVGFFHLFGRIPIANKIHKIFPEHKVYVEATCGHGEVIWYKEPSEVEVLNDINPDIIKLFKLVKNLKEEDYQKLRRRKWEGDKEYFNKLKKQEVKDDLDFLYKVLYLSRFGIRTKGNTLFDYGWRKIYDRIVYNWETRLRKSQERLKNVKLENKDYEDIVDKYDSKDTLFFFDPPYPEKEFYYQDESFDFERLFKVLKKIQGKFILVIFGNKEVLAPFEKEFYINNFRWIFPMSFFSDNVRRYTTAKLYSNFKFNLKDIEKSLSDEIVISIQNGKIPEEIYVKYAKGNEPLPPEFYTDYREGEVWCQTHIRGLKEEDVAKWKNGEITFAELIEGHSLHCDLRMDLEGLSKLVQWVITDNDFKSLLRMMKGEYTEIEREGEKIGQPQKSLAIVKPSALEEPEDINKTEDIKEKSISKEDAKLLEQYQIWKGSYLITAGEVGATAYKYAWMGLIWKGKVKAGVQRKDLKEYFFYSSSDLPSLNKELFDGKFIIRAFESGKEGNYWQIQKAVSSPFPLDPIEHKDSGYYFPVNPTDLKIGKEYYKYGEKEPIKKAFNLPSFVWINKFISLAGSILYDREDNREPDDIDIIIKGAEVRNNKFYIELDPSLRLKIDRVLKEELGKEFKEHWIDDKDIEWLTSKYGTNWRALSLYDLVLVPHIELEEIQEPEFKERFYKNEEKQVEEKEIHFDIINKNEEKHIVYGIVYSPYEVDIQGDWAKPEVIEEACHYYMLNSQKISILHKDITNDIKVVENYISPIDFSFNGRYIKKGTWIMAVKVFNNELWEAIKRGEYKGFSIGGWGIKLSEE